MKRFGNNMGIIIEKVVIRNFMSFGDYVTELPIGSMGPTLIVGCLNDDQKKSNGVGKTTITNAVLWCLFGRLFDLRQPGDTIINRQSGSNCLVRIITRDGWTITRTRKMEGSDDLLVYFGSDDKTRSTNVEAQKFIIKHFGLDYDIFVSSVFFGQFSKPFLEMADQQRKAALERLLGVHRLTAWSEAAKDKLHAAESDHAKYKAEIDNVQDSIAQVESQIKINTDRSAAYEEENKKQCIALIDECKALERKIKNWKIDELPVLQGMTAKWDLLRQLRVKYDKQVGDLSLIVDELNKLQYQLTISSAELQNAKNRMGELSEYDFNKLREQHSAASSILLSKNLINDKINDLRLKLRAEQQDYSRAKASIDELNNKAGKVCVSCKQTVDSAHIKNLCSPTVDSLVQIDDKIKLLTSTIATLEKDNGALVVINPDVSLSEIDRLQKEYNKVTTLNNNADKIITELNTKISDLKIREQSTKAIKDKIAVVMNQEKPKLLPDEINAQIKIMASEEMRLDRLQKELNNKNSQPNPYSVVVVDLQSRLSTLANNKKTATDNIFVSHNRVVHYNYLHKAYGDRKKIKSVILSELIPFFNKRIFYYLGVFECSIKIKFTSALGVETNKWKYNLCSGGQRRRIDLAIAFALHDLHLAIYGRQCNVILFDEVDGRLDAAGIEAFTNLVLDDISSSHGGKPGPDTVLVVSHKDEMKDAFPASIIVNMLKSNADDDDEDGLSYARYVNN